jgi:hypothetical protein
MSFYTPFALYQAGGVTPGFDTDAQAYIDAVTTAGGTLSAGDQTAINDFYVALKANSLYSELKYMYPFMGGVSASHAICGINPTDADYTITWGFNLTNAAAHTAAGIDTRTFRGYGTITELLTNIHSSVNNVAFGAVITAATTGDECFVIGKTADIVSNNRYQFNIPFDANNVYVGVGSANFTVYNNAAVPVGRWIGSRTSSTSIVTYKNGSSVATNTVANTGVLNNSPQFFSSAFNTASALFIGVCGFIFGGNGLSGAQVSTFDGLISTFQTAIGR